MGVLRIHLGDIYPCIRQSATTWTGVDQWKGICADSSMAFWWHYAVYQHAEDAHMKEAVSKSKRILRPERHTIIISNLRF